ncbi:BrnT family toxin [Salinibacter sp.]|uniref:BrnT family toxin n=1 Tax=Salinibacter sp. TaxID=2065818 RepID=UPI0021E9A489
MDFEWDPAKRETNLDKHGVDFLIATQVLTEPHLVIRTDQQPEPRWMAIGPLPDEHVPAEWSGPLCAVVYARRGDTYRMISARRARTDERDAYRTKISGRDSA